VKSILPCAGMIEEAYASANNLLRSRMDDLKAGARLLLERETITPEDFPPLQRREEAATAEDASVPVI
jgi:cell division protease FtsH